MLWRVEQYIKNIRDRNKKILDRFQNNYFKSNIRKCHVITSLNSPDELQISNEPLISKNRVKLLGAHTEGHVSFEYHIEQLC